MWVSVVVVLALVLGVALIGGLTVLYNAQKRPLPWSPRCAATVQGGTVEVDPDQAHYASIIAGVGGRRNLAPRAVTIALATAYQESGIHNIDYGDRDSLGLFQQRPSQGWGTAAQVMDPYYASRQFYAVMVGVSGWQSRDIGQVAQTVQRSGYPDAYDKHVPNARLLASSLSGETPASFSCAVRDLPAGDPGGLASFLKQTLPESDAVTRSGSSVTVQTGSTKHAWQAAHIAVANTATFGVRRVSVGDRSWTPGTMGLSSWEGKADQSAQRVVIDLS